MAIRTCFTAGLAAFLLACGSEDSARGADSSADAPVGESGQRAVSALPDPCEWLSPAEAQELLGLERAPSVTAMGDANAAGRFCVWASADRSKWLNAGYNLLNPQVFDTLDQPAGQLVELASNLYAQGLAHAETWQVGGRPALAFEDATQTILVLFSGIGKARDLPEGLEGISPVSALINPTFRLMQPDETGRQRLAGLKAVADRPMEQLTGAAD